MPLEFERYLMMYGYRGIVVMIVGKQRVNSRRIGAKPADDDPMDLANKHTMAKYVLLVF